MLQRPARTFTLGSPLPSSMDSGGPDVPSCKSCAEDESTSCAQRAGNEVGTAPLKEQKDREGSISPLDLNAGPTLVASLRAADLKPRQRTNLPPELWREIIRRATASSSHVFPTTSSPRTPNCLFGWPCYPVFDEEYYRSLATKYNVCLVSKQMKSIAEEFLYETIHLRRPEQALQLIGRFSAFCDDPVDMATLDQSSKQSDFASVLQRLESGLELDLSLGLKTLDLGSEGSKASTSCAKRQSKIEKRLQKCTKTLIIAPQFPPFSREEDADFIDAALIALHTLAKACTSVTDVFLTADHTSLFHGPTYQPWVRLLSALPQVTIRNLSVQDFLLGPVVWSPRLFRTEAAGSHLRTLHLDAEHPPIPHSFPHLTHLHLFSWPTASAWDLPSLTHLYIQYLPDVTATRSFWSYPPSHSHPGAYNHNTHTDGTRPPAHVHRHTAPAILERSNKDDHPYGPRREKLELLHFGFDTDLGLYFPDLPARIAWLAPNLRTLEYHVAGDLPVRFDPRALPRSLQLIKLQTLLLGAGMELPRWSEQESMSDYTHETLSAMEEYWKDRLTPEAVRRWSQVCNHLRAYGEDQVKPVVLFPNSMPQSRFF